MESGQRVDIAVLCHNAQTLVSLADPAKKVVIAGDRFRKWESPILCIAALMITTTVCFLLPSVYFLLMNLTLLGSVAGIGIAHLKGNILLKVLPKPIVADDHNDYVADLPEAQTHSEIMQQFKEILNAQLTLLYNERWPQARVHYLESQRAFNCYMHRLFFTDRVILGITRLINKLYEIIKWEDFNHSLRCYGISTVLVLLLHILPLRWTITLFVDGFVVYHPLKMIITEKYFNEDHDSSQDDIACTTSLGQAETERISVAQNFTHSDDEEEDEVSSENSSSDLSEPEGMEFGPSGVIHNNDVEITQDKLSDQQENYDVMHEQSAEPDNDMDSLSYDLEVSTEVDSLQHENIKKNESHQLKSEIKTGSEGTDTGSDTGSVEGTRLSSSPNRPTGVVGRIMEFKRKQQQANTGTCVGCGVNFTTILKRKRNCNYCGNSFCAKCCSYKIPKAVLGATAPGSQTDQVAVCHDCHYYLTASVATEKEMTDMKCKKIQE